MTKDTFFANFGYLADAPNGVKKLRELILHLAVQGKLVPQDPNDEPASVLLTKIKAEKERRVKEKKIKKSEPLPAVNPDDIPYELPNGWKWVRLPDITHDCGQKIPDVEFTYIDVSAIDNKTGAVPDEVTVIQPNNAPSRARKLVRLGSVIYSTVRPYLLNIAIIDKEFQPAPIVSTAFAVLHPYEGIVGKFLFYYLRSRPFIDYVEVAMTGMAYPAINDTKLQMGVVPVPPLAEQHRIVAKVDQLMALCDELETRQQKKKQRLITLNKAALDRLLTARETDDFTNAWRLIRDNFDFLYTAPETICKLRQSILQLAVQGKLVPQEQNDEPASTLLAKIKAEKERLVKEKKIKKAAPLPPVSPSEAPFELPKSWEWIHLDEISINVHYGYTASADHNRKDVRLLRITDIQNGCVNWDGVPGCEIDDRNLPIYALKNNDLLIARTGGTIGKTFLVEGLEVCAVFASYLIRVIPSRFIVPRYLKQFTDSPLYWLQLYEKSMGTGQPNVNSVALRSLIFPLPSYAEQHRIVTKVDQLMKLCDELETKLVKSQTKSEKLVEAAVKAIASN